MTRTEWSRCYAGTMSDLFHAGARELQDRFDTRRLADRLEQVTLHSTFNDNDRAIIERAPMFFLATADGDGAPDCSYKGGVPGFVKVVGPSTLAFPDYDGNGMFRSLGNVLVNERVALLFIDFERQDRLRIHGRASVSDDDELLGSWEGAQLVVRVEVDRVFPNCPRYIHRMDLQELSVYAPHAEHEPPVPEWKQMDLFSPYLPGSQP